MTRISLLTVVGLCLALSPLAEPGGAGDTSEQVSARHPIAFLTALGDAWSSPSRTSHGRAGAFLELTDVAP